MAAPAFELRQAVLELGGRPVLRGVDLAIAAGEALALVGPSGAGKTSLLRVLGGALPLDAGTLRFEGQPLAEHDLRAMRTRVGFVHQDHALVPTLRASQNVLTGRLGQRGFWSGLRSMVLPARADLERAHALLERVGVGERMFQRTDTLSGGQQQRVAIARALCQEPRALLADEPLASVDPARAADLLEVMLGLARERGLTLVASLHDVALVRRYFPRIVGLRDGRVAYDGAADAFDDATADALYALEEPRE